MKTINLLIATMLTQVLLLHAEGLKPNRQKTITKAAKGEIYLVQATQTKSPDERTNEIEASQHELNTAIEKLQNATTPEGAKQAKEDTDKLIDKVEGLIQEAEGAGVDVEAAHGELHNSAISAGIASGFLHYNGLLPRDVPSAVEQSDSAKDENAKPAKDENADPAKSENSDPANGASGGN